ncbi:hypothetical protein [Pseudomonas sp. TE3610]
MHRRTYLSTPIVQHFIHWMASHLDSPLFQHGYVNRLTGQPWQCQSLTDAYRQYRWPHPSISRLDIDKGHTAASNAAALLALKQQLQGALGAHLDDDVACQAAIEVMIWGGVQAHNVDWLIEHRQGLAALLVEVRDAIDSDTLAAPALLSPSLRFNAGMTKVYSLICRDAIIYDSRVAAALGWVVVKYCTLHGLSSVPPELAFPWAPAKEGNSATPKNRNPARGALVFPRLQAGTLHVQWNMRASWVLRAVLNGPLDHEHEFALGDGLRKLEAALFMIGYDLGTAQVATLVSVKPVQAEFVWLPGFTLTKRKPFHYRITPSEIIVQGNPTFSLTVINQTLTNLSMMFGTASFPLANSADGVRAGTCPEGIGLAYLRATNGRGNVPDTSKLAAILKDFGILTYARQTGLWALNWDVLGAAPQGAIDVGPILARLADDNDAD